MAFYQDTIKNVLSNINQENNSGLFLPYIQRDFVWSEENIYRLMDSLMRGYPVGTILSWETSAPISYRKFITDYASNYDFDADRQTNTDGTRKTYVLDGQQRLQSLYIVCFGSYEGKELYFDLGSDRNSDDGYRFEFAESGTKTTNWINVKNFLAESFTMATLIPEWLKQKGIIHPSLNPEAAARMGENAMQLFAAFKTIGSLARQTLSDTDITLDNIADVFVRTNSEGVVLEKADLLMALLRGRWDDADDSFKKINDAVTNMGYKKMKDFILRSCLAMLGEGTKYDAEKFAQNSVQQKIKDKFPDLFRAIYDVLSFVADFDLMGSKNVSAKDPLLLAICYRFAHPSNWEEAKKGAVAKFLFSAFLSSAFVRAPQRMVDAFDNYVKENADLDINEMEAICRKNERTLKVDLESLLNISMNAPKAGLVLHLFYWNKKLYDPKDNTTRDHIFPDSRLKALRDENGNMKYRADVRDQILNCELLTSDENNQKGDRLPGDFFKDQKPDFLALHGIPNNEELWDMQRFEDFIEARRSVFRGELSPKILDLAILQPAPPRPKRNKRT